MFLDLCRDRSSCNDMKRSDTLLSYSWMLSSELLVTQIVEIQWPYGTELLIEWSERFEPFLDMVL